MLVVFVAVLVATVQMFSIIPTASSPIRTTTRCSSTCSAAQGTSYYDMAKWTQQVADIVIRNPYVDSFLASVGGGPAAAAAAARTTAASWCSSMPRAQRDTTAQQIAQQLRPQLLRFPGFRGFVGLPPSLQIGGRMGNQNFSLMMQAHEHRRAVRLGAEARAGDRREVPEVQDVSTDMEMKSPRDQPGHRPRQGGRRSA